MTAVFDTIAYRRSALEMVAESVNSQLGDGLWSV